MAGIACYSGLEKIRIMRLVVAALALLGAGIGILYAGQSEGCLRRQSDQEDYGVLAAMLSSFGTAAGTIGTTIAVALMEIDGGQKLWKSIRHVCRRATICVCLLVPIGLVAM